MGNRVLRLLLSITAIMICHSAYSITNASFMETGSYQNVASFGNLLLKYYGIDSLATCLSEKKSWIMSMCVDSIGRIEEIYKITVGRDWKDEESKDKSGRLKELVHTFNSTELRKMEKLSRDHSIYFTCCLDLYYIDKVPENIEYIDLQYNGLVDEIYKNGGIINTYVSFPKLLCTYDREWCDSILKKDPKQFIEKRLQRLGGYIYYSVKDSAFKDSEINCARMLISMIYVFGDYNVSKWMKYNDAIDFSITYDNSDNLKTIAVTAHGRPILDSNSLGLLKDYINDNHIEFKNPLKKKKIKFKFDIDNDWHTTLSAYERTQLTAGLIKWINNVLSGSQKYN